MFSHLVNRLESGLVGAAFVDRHGFRCTLLGDRFLKVAARRSRVAIGTQQEIDRVPFLVDRAIEIFLFTVDLDIGLVHAPALADRALVPPKNFLR